MRSDAVGESRTKFPFLSNFQAELNYLRSRPFDLQYHLHSKWDAYRAKESPWFFSGRLSP